MAMRNLESYDIEQVQTNFLVKSMDHYKSDFLRCEVQMLPLNCKAVQDFREEERKIIEMEKRNRRAIMMTMKVIKGGRE